MAAKYTIYDGDFPSSKPPSIEDFRKIAMVDFRKIAMFDSWKLNTVSKLTQFDSKYREQFFLQGSNNVSVALPSCSLIVNRLLIFQLLQIPSKKESSTYYPGLGKPMTFLPSIPICPALRPVRTL